MASPAVFAAILRHAVRDAAHITDAAPCSRGDPEAAGGTLLPKAQNEWEARQRDERGLPRSCRNCTTIGGQGARASCRYQ